MESKNKQDVQELFKEQALRLVEIQQKQSTKRNRMLPVTAGIIMILIWILYIFFQKHCFIDFPLLVLLLLVTVFLLLLVLYKNDQLCKRIDIMLAERGEH